MPNTFTTSQQPIFDSKTNRILYFGGLHLDIVTYDRGIKRSYQNNYDFQNIMMFDMQTGQWGQQNLQGKPPSPRAGHSVTLRKLVFFFLVDR